MTGIDIEAAGIAQAKQRAASMGVGDRADFLVADCNHVLSMPDYEFDMIICIDAVIHLQDRLRAMRDWYRLLRPGGVFVLTDAAILTGPISKSEIDIRASQGAFVIVPPGANERIINQAGFCLQHCDDTTAEMAGVASRLHSAREKRAMALKAEEGPDWFVNRQRFLATIATLAFEARLSRFRYIVGKPS